MLQLLLAEVSVTDLICPRIVPLSQPELVRLEVHDDVLAAAVRHAGAAAAGPALVAHGGAVHPLPAAAHPTEPHPAALGRDTADHGNLVQSSDILKPISYLLMTHQHKLQDPCLMRNWLTPLLGITASWPPCTALWHLRLTLLCS